MMTLLGPDPTIFPPPESADEDGVLAIGGDLKPERLIQAYRRGIFPWYSEGLPIVWHCPDPRFVLEAHELHVPKSLKRLMKKQPYEIRMDTAFDAVVGHCAETPRRDARGTWITAAMRRAYGRLFELGYAHSIEAFLGTRLVGGLYGISIGAIFFGESMFALEPDASKIAFVAAVEWMRSWGTELIDCQQETAHLARFGATAWPRPRFLTTLARLVESPTRQGRWPNAAAPFSMQQLAGDAA